MNNKRYNWAVIGERGPEMFNTKGMRIYDTKTWEELKEEDESEDG